MSKDIDLDQPLSDFDRQYLVDRNRWQDLKYNAEATGGATPEDQPADRNPRLGLAGPTTPPAPNVTDSASTADQSGDEGEDGDDYDEWTVAELKKEMDRLELSYERSDKKDDLITKLRAYDDSTDEGGDEE